MKSDGGRFLLDEADMTSRCKTCILSDDTDVFGLPFLLGELGRHAVQGTDGVLG